MAKKHLVIVESPAKGKTIERYLGKDYQVLASYGHVRDLPKSKMGVETDDGSFTPDYLVPAKAKKTVSALKKAAAAADDIFLATDYDREGEAIAWHVLESLKLAKGKSVRRITFHEITKKALEEAVKKPRDLDYDLINAQQARRILDRLVGYTLSPFLWKKVMKGLSAGRVQSVAVRLIVDRENEIKAFKPEEYWSLDGKFLRGSDDFLASLVEFKGQKIEKMTVKTETEAKKIETSLKDLEYRVDSIEKKERQKRPSPPFTTSTLQQQAAHRLHFSAKQTMKLAQDLYEDGHITYMRTDSVNLADEALKAARSLVEKEYGQGYLPDKPNYYKTKSKGAQEAHEAIRPTHVESLPEKLNLKSEKHTKLYRLIWQRMVASQMSPARLKAETVLVKSAKGEGVFKATGNVVDFEGFLKVWPTAREDKILPALKQGEQVNLDDLVGEQHFTEPPPRYSEASLVKALEEHGIGRPSTYAPTLSTIQDRGYVELIERRFHPTETGQNVNGILVKHFPEIVDLDFTAEMEEGLDKVAEGKEDWTKLLGDFYKPFHKLVEKKTDEVPKLDLTEKTDKVCPECGKPMVIRPGRYGKFLACTGFPDCKHTEPIIKKTGITCPECGEGQLIERKTRRGKTFWGCERYPKCKHATWDDPTKKKEKQEDK
ncbi:type I DNA topoisomerase [Candidatus Berkelbacteria bacterium]|nr:type I DNA topoisomerase [Candidatus Berkelbacteria bacterium]